MPYEQLLSSVNPRLLVLLTDESEESVRVINRLIDHQIQIHCDSEIPKRCCFISVIGYNNTVKELCSGWLKDLDASPLRCDTLKKKFSDGVGGFVEIEVRQPVWIEPICNPFSFVHYAEALILAKKMAEKWADDHIMPPIVIDCSIDSHVMCAIDEINEMKNIKTEDGTLLFFGCYRESKNVPENIFSCTPKEWDNKFNNLGIMKSDSLTGCFTYDNIWEVFYVIMCGACLDRHRKNRI